MKIAADIFIFLKDLVKLKNRQFSKYLIINNSAKLYSNNSLLLEINDNKILLCGHDLTDKLMPKDDKLNKTLDSRAFGNFLKNISGSLLRLNHLGINYWCDDIDAEIKFYKKIINGSSFDLYEEKSDDPNVRWLFIGNTGDWQSPLFEIVLTTKYIPENEWRPHFQIDIDTAFKQKKLEKLLTKFFGNDFIQWKLNIPNYGIVLEMGMLESINGSKIYLGIGTNKRDTKYHREKGLKKLI